MACGNGTMEPGEVCDDGNLDGGDGCSADCMSDESCGNGITDWDAGETCDPPNPANQCSAACLAWYCGDGNLDQDEVCDDGNWDDGDGCASDCLSDESCGNSVVDDAVGEECDPPDPAAGCQADCTLLTCGNGQLEQDEACDDGNNVGGDGCSSDCMSDETCGNGITDWEVGEACDPADPATQDGCTQDCQTVGCGNGIVDAGEACDDGNTDGGDGCSADCNSTEICGNAIIDWEAGEECDPPDPANDCSPQCKSMYCGNGVIDQGEVCDDGNWVGGDGCSSDCTSLEQCGNGIVDWSAGEECDPPDPAANCSPQCKSMYCGNGVVEPGEVCDDGNWAGGDGCSNDCKSLEVCGNGIIDWEAGEECDPPDADAGCSDQCLASDCGNGDVEVGEVCDDGNWEGGDGCSSDCLSDESCGNGIVDTSVGETCDPADPVTGGNCTLHCQVPGCGNGVLEPGLGEVCDDANLDGGDGCSADCKSNETCGNDIVDWAAGEECDPPNGVDCSAVCLEMYCGNGIIDPGELCDDGNWEGGDGCSNDCKSDETCGNGITDWDAGESCDPPNPATNCSQGCEVMYCGNGILEPGELCDDGNWVGGDGCSSDCKSDETCGNGITDWDAGEECDPPDANNDCSATCKAMYCGNGVLDPGETCDDANWDDGDGCSNDCLSDETCGNGVVDEVTGEECDPPGIGAGCSTNCTLLNCTGDADCDDNNVCTTDACDPTAGCTYTNVSGDCDDGMAWTAGDTCIDGMCVGSADPDGDGVPNYGTGPVCDPPAVVDNCIDNCRFRANPAQADSNHDGLGDACVTARHWMSVNTTEPVVALTFDDGWDNDAFVSILGSLEAYHAYASFFLVGSYIDQGWVDPTTMLQARNSGHLLGNHTYDHLMGWDLATLVNQLNQCDQAFVDAGVGSPKPLFRPAGTDINIFTNIAAQQTGYTEIVWANMDPVDWSDPEPEGSAMVQCILDTVEPGDIILLHVGTTVTPQVLPQLLQGLIDKGYSMLNLEQMMAFGDPVMGGMNDVKNCDAYY